MSPTYRQFVEYVKNQGFDICVTCLLLDNKEREGIYDSPGLCCSCNEECGPPHLDDPVSDEWASLF